MTDEHEPHPVVFALQQHSALIARLTNLIDNLSARIEHLEQHDTCSTSPMWLRETEPDRWNITDHD